MHPAIGHRTWFDLGQLFPFFSFLFFLSNALLALTRCLTHVADLVFSNMTEMTFGESTTASPFSIFVLFPLSFGAVRLIAEVPHIDAAGVDPNIDVCMDA